MGVREYDYIKGNTALVPERQIKEKVTRDREKLQKKKREVQKNNKLTKDFMGIVFLLFILGGTSLWMDGYVYFLQKQLSNIEVQFSDELAINEALKLDMLKISSIEKVKTTAEKELGMVYPGKEGTISIDMSKEYFAHIKEEKENRSTFLAKLIDTFN